MTQNIPEYPMSQRVNLDPGFDIQSYKRINSFILA